MQGDVKTLIAQRVIQRGLVSREDVQRALNSFNTGQLGPDFGQALVRQGLLTPRQWEKVRQSLSGQIWNENVAVLHALQNSPINYDPRALAQARQMSAKMNISLGQALIKARVVSAKDYVQVLNRAKASVIECPHCSTKYSPSPGKDQILCSCGQIIAADLMGTNNPVEALQQNVKSGQMSGQRFGKYEILGEVARGGMGVIYKVQSPEKDVPLALKLLLRIEDASETQIKRFGKEARTAQKLSHPNIVKIWDFGELRGIPYLVMDFIEGTTLRHILKERGKLELDEGIELLLTLCRAMEHAHQKNIIHRDLKTDNVIIDRESTPWITDFGLAKDLASDTMLTQTGIKIGTPSYMAPEQAEGKSKYANPSTDIYALGVMLYHVLTGELPFQGRTPAELFYNIIHAPPPDPREANPDLPPAITTICQQAMAKDPDNRYQSAGDLARDIEKARSGETVEVAPKPEKPAGPTRRPSRRKSRRTAPVAAKSKPPVFVLAFVALLLIVLLLIVYLYSLSNSPDPKKGENTTQTDKDSISKGMPDPTKLWSKALAFRREGRIEEALKTFEELPLSEVNSARGQAFYGQCMLDKKQLMKAQMAFDQALSQDPSHWDAQLGKTRCLQLLGQFKRAYRKLQELHDKAPKHRGVQRDLARLHLKFEQYSQALPLLNYLLEEEVTSVPVRLDRGICLYHLGKFKRGISDLTLLLKERPKHPKGLLWTARTEVKLNRVKEAGQNYTTLAELRKDDFELAREVGDFFFTTMQFPSSIQYYNRAIQINPQYAPALYGLAQVYLDIHHYEWGNGKKSNKELLRKAERYMDQAVKLDGKSPYALHHHAQVLGKKNRRPLAIQTYTEAIKKSSNPYEEAISFFSRANYYLLKKEVSRGVVDLKKTLEVLPSFLQARLQYASISYFMKNHETALRDLKIFLGDAPKEHHGEAHYYKSFIHLYREQYGPGLGHLKQALSERGNSFYYKLAKEQIQGALRRNPAPSTAAKLRSTLGVIERKLQGQK